MGDFVVSARKYRPTTFNSVVGQQSITNTLKNAIKTDHLAQAFLFCGSRGVGKTTCARILAKTINCFNRTEQMEACNECDSCKGFNEGSSLNIYELDAASNNSVDDIRNLTDQVRFAPQIGSYKVYIIDEVHMLSKSAFNAFLKTLEEPPAHAIFILATTEKHKIIPTILSRCQIFDFHRIGVEDIADHLAYIAKEETIEAEEEALHMIAEKADGALRDALSIFDQLVSFSGNKLSYEAVIENLNILDYDYYFRCTDHLLQSHISEVLLLFNEVLTKGFDGHLFINGLASHFRNLLVCQDEQTLTLLEVGKNIREKYHQQAKNCETNFLMQAMEVCRTCDVQYKGSKNQRLLVELSLMQMASLRSPNAQLPEKKKPRIKSVEELPQGSESPTAVKDNAQKSETAPPQTNKEPLQEKQKEEAVEKSEPKPTPAVETETQAAPLDQAKKEVQETSQVKEPKAEEKAEKPPQNNGLDKFAKLKAQRAKTSTLSISKLTQEEEAKAEEKAKSAYVTEQREDFTEEVFLKTWQTLAEKIKEANAEGSSMIYAAMTTHKVVLMDNYQIGLRVDNKSQLEEMTLKRGDIHDFLRKKLKNGLIELHLKIVKDKKQKKAYTPEEKFEKLAEENPILLKLKKEFDLDFF
ncbi:MAG: DNA polymerase III subunit gamma/tau [Vicingaceae bacterium]